MDIMGVGVGVGFGVGAEYKIARFPVGHRLLLLAKLQTWLATRPLTPAAKSAMCASPCLSLRENEQFYFQHWIQYPF